MNRPRSHRRNCVGLRGAARYPVAKKAADILEKFILSSRDQVGLIDSINTARKLKAGAEFIATIVTLGRNGGASLLARLIEDIQDLSLRSNCPPIHQVSAARKWHLESPTRSRLP